MNVVQSITIPSDAFDPPAPDEPAGHYKTRKSCQRGVGWLYSPKSGSPSRLPCKSRQCPHCSIIWASTWRDLLKQRTELRIIQLDGQIPTGPLALTLTTAYNPGYKKLHAALRYFWQLLRDHPRLKNKVIEYWGVTEFNQLHTQPHLHFVLPELGHIRYKIIRYCWKKAQAWAQFERIAWDVRIEKVKAGIQAYLAKYLTKLADGGKDEIPRRANWKGRYVRYSRNFFKMVQPEVTAPTAAMRQLIKFQLTIAKDAPRAADFSFYSYTARSPREKSSFIEHSDNEYRQLLNILSTPNSYIDDFKDPRVERLEHTYQLTLPEPIPDWQAIKTQFAI